MSYGGALIAPTAILAIPFYGIHKAEAGLVLFWLFAVLEGAVILWVLVRATNIILSSLRRGFLFIEDVVAFIAFALVPIFVAFVFPPR